LAAIEPETKPEGKEGTGEEVETKEEGEGLGYI